MKIKYVIFLTIFSVLSGIAIGFYTFSVYWRDYNSGLISQTYSNLDRYSGALSGCEKQPDQCSAKFVSLLQDGYLESLTLATGIYVISQDESYKSSACGAIRRVKSKPPYIIEVEADANKHLLCESGI